VRAYPDNHRRLFDGGNDLELAATLRAVFEVDIEHALEQARPAHARRGVCVFLGVSSSELNPSIRVNGMAKILKFLN